MGKWEDLRRDDINNAKHDHAMYVKLTEKHAGLCYCENCESRRYYQDKVTLLVLKIPRTLPDYYKPLKAE